MNNAHTIANILLEIGAFTLNVSNPYKYSSGLRSPIYCDNRLLISYPLYRSRVCEAFATLLDERKVDYDVVGGTATAGIPHAAWLADKVNKPMIYIRKASKGYGKDKLYEGIIEQKQKVLIVEDLISTGSSALSASEAIIKSGAMVTDIICIFTYGLEKALKAFQSARITLHALTSLPDLLEVAVKNGKISLHERDVIKEWAKNPDKWGDRLRT